MSAPIPAARATAPVLDVAHLTIAFPGVQPVRDLSFELHAGETLAIVGESGSGKSLTALAAMGLLPPSARVAGGSIRFNGQDISSLDERQLTDLRGNRLAMIFQEPMTSLNPVMSIGAQIAEAIQRHERLPHAHAWARAVAALDQVRIPHAATRAHDYPHQLSGGQRQRVMIAMAIALRPKLLIADEPTTALDATVQAQVLALIDQLRRELNMAVLLITHDLSVVARWSDRTLVMHQGVKLEAFATADLGLPLRHPYTQGLMQASVRLERGVHYSTSSLAEIKAVKRDDGGQDFRIKPPVSALPGPRPAGATELVRIDNLSVDYASAGKRALDRVSLSIATGETLGIVGESGSGKSTLSKALMQLVPFSGEILFEGQDLARLSASQLRQQRRRMQMIFQDPFGSLNPRKCVSQILETPLLVHGYKDRHERRRLVSDTLDHVGLPQSALARYPHEFSGGQRQRIGIARALILRPSLVICDEPVSALDVSIQAQILNLLVDLKRELGLSYLFISHDLAVVQYISDRVAVMKDARIVEQADHRQIWTAPQTDYTRSLIAAASGAWVPDGARQAA
ncbi:ABC transporter ATP-binding protein [Bordetella genomosp. 12]|uniref:Glutathione ABC transporter ATP-binding protein GsiA n=1 Tax=Bordetella genomosp. 12 TaxID=463035 RepID=A0A261VET4_9BORD|nr:ABC transporter ATP-binding protein [Bordetella genomosp. 12]OZI71663.1 glutathione ABC transporter ATP-binding protein GsiA [Bordetella genomosp. 12]